MVVTISLDHGLVSIFKSEAHAFVRISKLSFVRIFKVQNIVICPNRFRTSNLSDFLDIPNLRNGTERNRSVICSYLNYGTERNVP